MVPAKPSRHYWSPVESHVGRSENMRKDLLRPAPKDSVAAFENLSDLVPVRPLPGLIPSANLDNVSDEYTGGSLSRT